MCVNFKQSEIGFSLAMHEIENHIRWDAILLASPPDYCW